jgi:hypothetical protein
VLLKRFSLLLALSLLLGACQKANNVVIDSSPFVNAQLTYFDRDSSNDKIDITAYMNSNKPLTINDSFQVSVNPSQYFDHLGIMVQNDSGNMVAQDSFSKLSGDLIGGTLSFTLTSVYVGEITYIFTAYNKDGTPGSYATKVVELFNSAAGVPVVDSVSVPDSVRIDTVKTTPIILSAYVHDPSGLSDISSVYFNSTLPDGSPDPDNPFAMSPATSSGNEERYTLTVGLPPLSASNPNPPPLGTYTFTFYAVSRSGLSSDSLSHKITVYR